MRKALLFACLLGPALAQSPTPPPLLPQCSATRTSNCTPRTNSSGAYVPPSGGSASYISCVGTPGNTVGAAGSVCVVPVTGALYTCKATSPAACSVAADWAAQQGSATFGAVPDAAPIAWNLSSRFVANGTVTLANTRATRALNISNPVSGGFYTLVVKQDSTGGAVMTGGTGCTWLTPGGLSTGAFSLAITPNAINTVSFAYDGTNCLVLPAPAFTAM